jgi:hypothetical protein
MSQISKKFIQNNAIGASKIRLENNAALKARNNANNADVNILLVDSSDVIQFSSVPQVSSDPVFANDLVRKNYVDSQSEGLKPKEAVKAATTANITLSGTQTIDGIALSVSDRVLVKDQTSAPSNGIYVVAAGAWSRATDFDSITPIDEINGAYTFVQEGTANAGKGYVQTGDVTTLGVSDITFIFFNSTGSVTGGDMITVTGGNVVSVDLASVSGLESTNPGDNAGQLRVKLEASNPSLQIDGSNQLAAKFDDVTIETSAAGLRVKDSSITTVKLANNIDVTKLADGSVDNTEFQFLDGVTSNIQSQLDNKQPLDATLTALAAYNTTGFLVQTAADTFAGRSLVAGTGISITNPAGTAGDITIDSTVTQYTDEQAQDAVGSILTDSATIDFTYDDATPAISAIVIDGSISNAKLGSGIAADKIGAGLVDNTEFGYLDGATSNIQSQLDAKISTSLTSAQIFVGNASNVATAQALSGDVTMTNAAVVTIENSAVTTAKIANDAVDKDKIAADVAGSGLAQNVDGSLELNLSSASALEISSDQLQVKTDNSTVKINGSNNLESLKKNEQVITLDGSDISNQFVDLAQTAQAASSVSLTPVGGPQQQIGVDFTISLTGGAGGVTRVVFNGDLATGGAAELVATDVLIVSYLYL